MGQRGKVGVKLLSFLSTYARLLGVVAAYQRWREKMTMKHQGDWMEPYFCIMEIWLIGWRKDWFCNKKTKVVKAWGKMLNFGG